jgi:hypothetical protein
MGVKTLIRSCTCTAKGIFAAQFVPRGRPAGNETGVVVLFTHLLVVSFFLFLHRRCRPAGHDKLQTLWSAHR